MNWAGFTEDKDQRSQLQYTPYFYNQHHSRIHRSVKPPHRALALRHQNIVQQPLLAAPSLAVYINRLCSCTLLSPFFKSLQFSPMDQTFIPVLYPHQLRTPSLQPQFSLSKHCPLVAAATSCLLGQPCSCGARGAPSQWYTICASCAKWQIAPPTPVPDCSHTGG